MCFPLSLIIREYVYLLMHIFQGHCTPQTARVTIDSRTFSFFMCQIGLKIGVYTSDILCSLIIFTVPDSGGCLQPRSQALPLRAQFLCVTFDLSPLNSGSKVIHKNCAEREGLGTRLDAQTRCTEQLRKIAYIAGKTTLCCIASQVIKGQEFRSSNNMLYMSFGLKSKSTQLVWCVIVKVQCLLCWSHLRVSDQ